LPKETEASEVRRVLESAISNCIARRKDVVVTWKKPLQVLLDQESVLVGGAERDSHRTAKEARLEKYRAVAELLSQEDEEETNT
jgi:hypothetical protein